MFGRFGVYVAFTKSLGHFLLKGPVEATTWWRLFEIKANRFDAEGTDHAITLSQALVQSGFHSIRSCT